uniref:Zona pellucida glycoprotein 1 n=1 Tax=Saimiri boliviensis boliviensis TaxID=39432 RepID=A0A2K6S9P3_SAIBB
MAGGASAMTWGYRVALLLLVTTLGLGRQLQPDPGLPGLWHSYDSRIKGVQPLVFPRPGQALCFEVVDEFGNRFDVNNCPICYHWVTSRPQEAAVFSADYRGCHMLEKDGHFHLRVFMEAVLPNGHVDILAPPAMFSVFTPQTLPVHPTSGHTSSGSGHAFPSPLDPGHSSAHPTLALPFPGPGPALETLAQRHWGPMERWDVNQSAYVGTHLSQEQGTSKEACQQAGCCYDTTTEIPSYYGNTATVQCFRDGYFILVVSQEIALTQRITLANVCLAYAPTSCSPFPLTHCGTTVQLAGDQLVYENRLVASIHIQKGPQGSITPDSTVQLHVCCVFNASDFLPIQASIFPPPLPAPVTQPGPLQLELRIAKGMLYETFSSYYGEDDCPIVRLLREPVHVEVQLLQRTDPKLVLLLHQCWGAPGANPFQQPQWPILSDGCPFEGDSYRTQMVALDRTTPFQSHYQQFTVATFALLDSGSQRVYFLCSTSARHTSGLKTCSTACRPGTGQSSGHRNDTARPQDMVSSPGPVGASPSPTFSFSLSLRPLLWVVLSLPAVFLVLGFGVFVGLSQKLWESNSELAQ